MGNTSQMPSGDEALQRLLDGNERFVAETQSHPHQNSARRIELGNGQAPFAAVLACADSRVPPEVLFDQGLGDLFVVRVAGNIINDQLLGSLEYAAAHLHTPLIMVMGHTKCGAIGAVASGAELEGHIASLAPAIQPAVDKVKDQDGEPIAGADVVLTGEPAAATDAAGVCVFSDVAFGEYTITVTVGDEEQTSRIRIASTQKQYVDFVFSVEKWGTIEVYVKDQQGNPLPDADVYVDGYKEGKTGQNGIVTTTASEGRHFVEVRWQNETASQSVTVVRDQTSAVEITVYIPVETTLEVSVKDTNGNAVSGASVYLDNIFLGRTDTAGHVNQNVLPGSYTVRAEKQGFQSAVQNTVVQEGVNTVTVIMTEEQASITSILVLLGLFLLLKRR